MDGATFDFGENWGRFLPAIDAGRITTAEASLQSLLGRERLDGLSFLDIGSGSGLFSLAAHRLGARVHSFDYSPGSVACTETLRDRHASESALWTVERGSILDAAYVSRLGRFDIVYSWGVLHHTGAMWEAVDHAASLVVPGGLLAIALYHKTPACALWKVEKRLYASAPPWGRRALDGCYAAMVMLYGFVRGINPAPQGRGMAFMTNVRDWLGGYPYESAAPSEVFSFARERGLISVRSNLCQLRTGLFGTGCDEYVFRAATS